MKKKNIALIAAGAIGAGLFAGVQIDRHYNMLYDTNTAYCTVRNAIFGTDGGAEVDVALYYDIALSRSQMRNARRAFDAARGEYREEFNISFGVISEERARIGSESIDGIADLSLVFVKEIPDEDKTDTKKTAGLANRRNNIVLIEYTSYDECLESVLLHEIGHMFYAEHSDNPFCVMFHHSICFKTDEWCDDEKAIITKYKHRFW